MRSNARNIEVVIRSAKVLIVDDEFYMCKIIRTLLLSAGVTDVHEAGDGASGLAAISALDPDVVILDWQKAGMDGVEFVRRGAPPPPVFLFTQALTTYPRPPHHTQRG